MFASNETSKEAFGVEIALSPAMQAKQAEWRSIAGGDAPWNDKDTPSQRLAALVSQEVASMAAYGSHSEVIAIEESARDKTRNPNPATNPRAEYINTAYQQAIDDLINAIAACSNGGEIIYKPSLVDDGAVIALCETDFYWPIAYDSRGNLIKVVFGATASRGEHIYKLLELHEFDKPTNTHAISYRAFRAKENKSAWNPQELGEPANVADVPEWANLQDVTITRIERPLFVHVRMPIYDFIERPQLQGMPIWSKASQALKDADVHSARMRRNMKDTELALVINADKYISTGGKAAKPGRNGLPDIPASRGKLELPDGDGRKFIALQGGDTFATDVFNPPTKVEEYLIYMNTVERNIERLSNLSSGTIADLNTQAKTAEEFKKTHRKTITTIGTIQTKVFQPALEHLAYSLDMLADIQRIPPGGYEVIFDWDDSYATDRAAEFKERLEAQRNGILFPQENRGWWYGVSADNPIAQDVPGLSDEFN